MLGVLGVAVLVVVGPVIGFSLPWRTVFDGTRPEHQMRVITWNLHGKVEDPTAFSRLVRDTDPDLVVLQSWSSRYQAAFFGEGDWYMLRQDQFFVASRFPILSVESVEGDGYEGGNGGAAHYTIELPVGIVDLFNVHLASPRDGLEAVRSRDPDSPDVVADNTRLRSAQSRAVSDQVRKADDRVLIVGDFNLPSESAIYQACWSRYDDAFSRAGWGIGNTFFTHPTRVRIDHLLSGAGWRCRRAWVGPYVGSPHRPVVADFEPR
jgi:endonuclease/exonuclease/phosphatase family metal-dependent hydrolase